MEGLLGDIAKCEACRYYVTYLGQQVGQGAVSPRTAQARAILGLLIPQTKHQLMPELNH